MSLNNTSFSSEELAMYSRHLIIPEFGIESQKKLKLSKVLVIGAGGLGSPLLLYLAAAGVGKIGIVDFDRVEKSNLHRQVIFDHEDVGKSKVECARNRLKGINPFIEVELYDCQLNNTNALSIIGNYDVVADGTDNFPTRYLVNDACVLLNKPNVYASIFQFEGQVSVFNYTHPDGTVGPNYRDLFAAAPPEGVVPSCSVGGVLGVLPGIVGALQALEVIKVITGIGDVLSGRLYTFDALTFQSKTLSVKKDDANPLTGRNPTIKSLGNYGQSCESPAKRVTKSITVEEFFNSGIVNVDFQLIDVREPAEYAQANLGGTLIPVGTIVENYMKIDRNIKTIIHCKSGARSKKAIQLLEDQYQFENLYNLEGGIDACLIRMQTLKQEIQV